MELDYLKVAVNEHAVKNGFWDKPNIPEKLMLIVSELSEALEADRTENRCTRNMDAVLGWVGDDSFKEYFENNVKDTFEDELADAFIRLLDLCTHLNIDLMKHAEAKHRFNTLRPYKHGKKY